MNKDNKTDSIRLSRYDKDPHIELMCIDVFSAIDIIYNFCNTLDLKRSQ